MAIRMEQVSKPAARKRRHRKLRKCSSFERGKCATCETNGGPDPCDMKEKKDNEQGSNTDG
jgi:hypothetical protein